MKLYQYPHLIVKTSPVSGYGVFATEDIVTGTLLAACHHVPIQREEMKDLLRDYRFISNKERTHFSIVFGYGSLFNSSETPNAAWEFPTSLQDPFIFITTHDIKKGEEIFLNYHNSLRNK